MEILKIEDIVILRIYLRYEDTEETWVIEHNLNMPRISKCLWNLDLQKAETNNLANLQNPR